MSGHWFSAAFYPAAPARRLALLRIAVGLFAFGYLALRYVGFTSVATLSARQFAPVGAVRLLSQPLPGAAVQALLVAALLFAAAFALGVRYRVTAPLFALLLLWVTSYRSSWGMLFHTDNLLVLHVLLLAPAPAADALSVDARGGSSPAPADDGRYGWALRAVCLVTIVTYVVAGVAKLKLGGLGWLEGEQLRGQIAYDNLRKVELGREASALGVWFVRHPAFFPPLAALTLLVELGAPLVLLHRRVALVWSLLAWGFHVGVAMLMNIKFPYPLAFVPYLAFFRLELWHESWLGGALKRRLPAFLSAALTVGCVNPALPPLVTHAPQTVDPQGPIIVLGDTQRTSWAEELWGREQNERPRRQLMATIAAQERPAFVVHLGDMVVSGASAFEWRYFDHLVSPLTARGIRIRPLLGNHDYWGNDAVALERATAGEHFPELATRFYSATHRGLGLIWLDSNLRGRRGREQARWYQDTLAAFECSPSTRAVLVFTHHPPFTNGKGKHPESYVVEQILQPFLRSPKAQVMLSGHVHGYERFEHAGKTFVVTGGAGGGRVSYEAPGAGGERPAYQHPSDGLRPFNYVSISLAPDTLRFETKCLGAGNGCNAGRLDQFSVALPPATQKNCEKKSTVAAVPNGGQK
jgi:3',5'-cyclic AMP phosphodiesterase CpdA